MPKRLCLVALLLALMPGLDTSAGQTDGSFRIYGEGLSSCGEWVSERSANRRTAMVDGAWVLGFVSGVGWSGVRGNLKRTDTAGIEAWMDSYCRANPLKNLAEAAGALVDELATK